MPLNEVKAHLSEVVQRVNTQHERVTITVHGHASAVLVSSDDPDRLEETIAVLSDSNLLHQLAEAEADLAAGQVETVDTLSEAMRSRAASA